MKNRDKIFPFPVPCREEAVRAASKSYWIATKKSSQKHIKTAMKYLGIKVR